MRQEVYRRLADSCFQSGPVFVRGPVFVDHWEKKKKKEKKPLLGRTENKTTSNTEMVECWIE